MSKVVELPLVIDPDLVMGQRETANLAANPVMRAARREVLEQEHLAQEAQDFALEVLEMARNCYHIAAVLVGCQAAISTLSANLLARMPGYVVEENTDGLKVVRKGGERAGTGKGAGRVERMAVRPGHEDEDGHDHLCRSLGVGLADGGDPDCAGEKAVLLRREEAVNSYDAWDVIINEGHVILEDRVATRLSRAAEDVRKWVYQHCPDETPEPFLELFGALDEAGLM